MTARGTKRRRFVLVALATGAVAVACTINPQPLPPDSLAGPTERDGTAADASVNSDGSDFKGVDSGSADAAQDSAVVPQPPPSDGGTVEDAANPNDAADATDAMDDAPTDALTDAPEDGG